ncbi:MAG: hybrid sensor histidine kinase/response regulator [Candidatus Omnitrophica bacterium]|nr:hybrid sensor histidine kinase/response regulator [Candidatus Omnitrophota bacterium]
MSDKQAILIVDDEPQNRELLQSLLLPLGYETLSASNGEEALSIINDKRIDLVLLDVMLPGMDGFQVCKAIKSNERTKVLPVVMVTVLKEKEDRIVSLELGADDFLSKPINKMELLARVRSLLRIKSLHDQLEQSYTKLKDLQKLKDDLSAMISHDINNFLAGIRGNLDLAFFEVDKLPEEVKRYLNVASECTNDIIKLVTDFMDINRMEENKLTLNKENLDINALISEAVGAMDSVAKEAGVELAGVKDNNPLYFKADKTLILRTITNLIINSIKFTPAGGKINVFCRQDPDGLRVWVKDTGSGIPKEYKERIFEKFSQVEVKQANLKKGRGLGLTLCKLAVEAHGGKIWVESEGKDKGSEFIFTIPK